MQDRRLATVLGLLHQQLWHSWTITELRSRAGILKSLLSEKFTELIGLLPFTDYQYVFINFPKPVIRFDISKKRVKDYIKAIGQHVKTDYIDAQVVRRYAEIIQSKTI